MEKLISQLKKAIALRKDDWEEAKNPNHATSIFVSNRRIQKLDDAFELIAELEEIEEYTKR